MHYTFSELIWLVLIYSFLGWFIETIVGTIRKKKFVNRGFSSGPFCFIYGTAALIMIISLEDLENQPFFLFLGCMIIATTIEWFAGKILERMNQRKWWDYSDKNGILTDISVCSTAFSGEFLVYWQSNSEMKISPGCFILSPGRLGIYWSVSPLPELLLICLCHRRRRCALAGRQKPQSAGTGKWQLLRENSRR